MLVPQSGPKPANSVQRAASSITEVSVLDIPVTNIIIIIIKPWFDKDLHHY
jgi:hypothetical protein